MSLTFKHLIWSFLLICVNPVTPSYDVVYNWNQMTFDFTSAPPSVPDEYIPQNNALTGVKLSGSRMFITIPRWYYGVPATLSVLPYDSGNVSDVPTSPDLLPFPSWEMNEIGNCGALQNILGLEVDQYNRLWVLDGGRFHTFENNGDNRCAPKLVIFDLNMADGTIVRFHEFPSTVVNQTENGLNDIVVGCASEYDCWAYMTDAATSTIIVYNFGEDSAWFVQHSTMVKNDSAVDFEIDGQNYTFNTNVDGISLSPWSTNFDTLYYCPLSSYQIYSVPTRVLQDGGNSHAGSGFILNDRDVTVVGTKLSQADGMVMDSTGVLYYGAITRHSIMSWNTSIPTSAEGENEELVEMDGLDMKWLDTFTIDQEGFLFASSNRLHQVQNYDLTDTNFRIVRVFLGTKSYMFPPQ